MGRRDPSWNRPKIASRPALTIQAPNPSKRPRATGRKNRCSCGLWLTWEPSLSGSSHGVLRAIAHGAVIVARRYPRHSLAAAASVLILGAIWYTQLSPGLGAHGPVANQIKGEPAAAVAKDPKKTADPKTDGAARPRPASPQ